MLHNLEIIWHGPYRVEFLENLGWICAVGIIVWLSISFTNWSFERERRRGERRAHRL